MYKRIVSLLLAAALCFGMLPVTVLAEETDAAEETMFTEEADSQPEETQETQASEETEPPQTEETQGETEAWTEATEEPETQPLETEETTGESVAETVTVEAAEAAIAEETEEPEELAATGWIKYALDEGEREYTDEEAFAAYAERVFYGLDTMPFGTAAGSRLTGNEKTVYDVMAVELKKVADGEREDTFFVIGADADEIESESAVKLEWRDGTICDWNLVLDALRADLAYELYWANLYTTKEGECATAYRFTPVTDDYVQMRIYINTAAAYRSEKSYDVKYADGTTEKCYWADTKKTGAAKTAAGNAQDVVRAYAGLDDYYKLKAYADWISDAVEYNDPAAETGGYVAEHIDPWQMIYVFDDDDSTNVVCEGYSKAFQYLCDMSDFRGEVTCYRVWGDANGAHMWNTVNIDGDVYLVDVTNYDQPNPWEWLFMVGEEKKANSYTFTKGSISLTYAYAREMYDIYNAEEALELSTGTYKPNHQHSFQEDLAQKIYPTCTESGTAVFICPDCGFKKTELVEA